MKKKNIMCLALIALLMTVNANCWALPKDVYQEWKKRYMDTVDTVLFVKVASDDGAIFCGLRSKLWLPCYCSVYYEVVDIEKKPEALELKVGDHLSLKYRCNKNKAYVAHEGTLPWMDNSQEKDIFILHFRYSY